MVDKIKITITMVSVKMSYKVIKISSTSDGRGGELLNHLVKIVVG